ncbi:MAG: zinc-binding alcohol dehydrogenase family protein [Thermoleophilaceae bacterium]
MRAALVEEIGKPPVFTETAPPKQGPGETLVAVTAAPINPVDLSTAAGRYPGGSPETPYIPGREAVGTVAGSNRFGEGTRVYLGAPPARNGAMAEFCACPDSEVFAVPSGIDDSLAACFGVAGLAGWLPITWRGRLKEGETVLVLGATGPVGKVAVQAAKLNGAGRVIAVARDPQELERVKELGADATVRIGEADDLAQAFRDAAEGDIQLVIDPLWGEPGAAALEALAIFGRHVQIGQTASPTAEIRSGAIRTKNVEILGHTNHLAPTEVREQAYREMCEHAAAGRLKLEYEELPLEQIREAWERQERFPHKKLVLRP